jgi:hypothetical protein
MSQAYYANSDELTVRVDPRGDKYICELHRDGCLQPVKFFRAQFLVRTNGQRLWKRSAGPSFDASGSQTAASEVMFY